jgi:hypothetical protein
MIERYPRSPRVGPRAKIRMIRSEAGESLLMTRLTCRVVDRREAHLHTMMLTMASRTRHLSRVGSVSDADLPQHTRRQIVRRERMLRRNRLRVAVHAQLRLARHIAVANDKRRRPSRYIVRCRFVTSSAIGRAASPFQQLRMLWRQRPGSNHAVAPVCAERNER